MEKEVTIEGQKIKLKTHGNIPNLYKKQFGADFILEIQRMQSNGVDMELFNNFLWLAAKEANKEIPPPDEWNSQFDSYPIINVVEDVRELITSLMGTGKKSAMGKAIKA